METIRLSRLMASKGICSRREADDYIRNGWVLVDGCVINKLGARVLESQEVSLLEPARARQSQKLTVALNKPVGYVSGTPEKNYKPAVILIRASRCMHPIDARTVARLSGGLAPAGRLDIDSEGLLILTQDGRVARRLIGSDTNIEKEYLVRFGGAITEQKLDLLRHGICLDGRALKPAGISLINKSQLRIILVEGRKRQIRRMCESVGLSVLKLQRVRIGDFRLANLPLGKWRLLDAKTVKSFM